MAVFEDDVPVEGADVARDTARLVGWGALTPELPAEIKAPASVPWSVTVHPNMASTGVTLTFARVGALGAVAGSLYLLSLPGLPSSTSAGLSGAGMLLAVAAAFGGLLLGLTGPLMRRIVPDRDLVGLRERDLLGRALGATGRIRTALADIGDVIGDDETTGYAKALEVWEWQFARILVNTQRQAIGLGPYASRRNRRVNTDAMYRGLERRLERAELLGEQLAALAGERDRLDADELKALRRDLDLQAAESLRPAESWWMQ